MKTYYVVVGNVFGARIDNKKAARLDCFVLEQKTRLEPALRVGNFSRTIFTPPTPGRGEWGRS